MSNHAQHALKYFVSSGHSTTYRHSETLVRELKRLLADERVKKLLSGPIKVSFDHEMPLTGGSTVKWGTFFLDPKLKKPVRFPKGREVDLSRFVLRHEVVEKALRQVFGMGYLRAHSLATCAERLEVESEDLPWGAYKNIMESIVRRDEHERPKSLPKDYDYGPLRASRGVKSLKGIKFASGGYVRGYDDGGDVVPLDQDLLATPKPGKIVPPADTGQAAARLPGQIANTAWNASGLGDVYNTIRRGGSWTDVAGASVPLAMGMMAGPEERGVAAAEEAAAPALKGIIAYHGSPYDFDRFDISQIGTGEGAQSYGRGLYFAENPEVAQWYKEMAESGGKMYQARINADPEHFLDWDRPLSEQHPKVQEAMRPVIQRQLEKVDSLPWSGVEKNDLRQNLQNGNMTGAELYRAEFGHEGDPAALRQAGIPGVKYLDQGSRRSSLTRAQIAQQISDRQADLDYLDKMMADPSLSNQEIGVYKGQKIDTHERIDQLRNMVPEEELPPQTHNYVVFNDNLINIIKKYGMAGLIAGGAAHFSMPASGQKQYARGGRTDARKRSIGYALDFATRQT